jgi:cytochrome c peroxidase
MKLNRLLIVCVAGSAIAFGADTTPGLLKQFAPLPEVMTSESNPVTSAKIQLGRMLYYEPRLSRAHDVSCNTCHPLNRYGADGESVSTGFKGFKGGRNAPTVYNAAGHFVQFWDGRAPDVEEQAKGPVMNPVEMAMPSEQQAVAVLSSMPGYVQAFGKAFPGEKDPVTFDNMAKAIGAFERGLVTPARWDRYLRGDENALTAPEKTGLKKFVSAGCASCHNGAYVGGQQYQKLGVAQRWDDDSDTGRFKITKSDADRQVFKVPSLRNIEKTGPYFHNGKVASLDQAVELMARHELGRNLTTQDKGDILTWLNTLTGEIPLDYIREPQLPKSTARTPKPDLTD